MPFSKGKQCPPIAGFDIIDLEHLTSRATANDFYMTGPNIY